MKYSQEKKAEALARIAEIGVAKTSEEMSISVQTLYKWRNEGQVAPAVQDAPASDMDAVRTAIINDKYFEDKVQKLEAENSDLRDENKTLREKMSLLKQALAIFIG